MIRLWHHMLIRRKFQFLGLLILIVIASFVEVISIGAVIPFLGLITNPEKVLSYANNEYVLRYISDDLDSNLLLLMTVTFAIAALISGLIRILLLWTQTQFCHAVGSDFNAEMYKKTLYQPYSSHLEKNSSEVISTISISSKALIGNALIPLMTIISSVILLGVILFALVSFEPVIAILAFCGFGVIYLMIGFITKKTLLKNSEIISVEQSRIIKALQEGLGGIRDILIDGSQTFYCSIYEGAERPLRRAIAKVQIITICPRYIIETLGMTLIVFLAYCLIEKSGNAIDIIPVLGVFALGAQKILPLLQQSYANWASMRGGHALICDALDLLDKQLPSLYNDPVPQNILFQNQIHLNNITFKYSDEAADILQKINLRVFSGDILGVIGQTGSGKSTLLDVMMGLLIPSQGTISIDGLTINASNMSLWWRNIAHVPQHIYLSDSSLAENIAFGVAKKKIDIQKLHEVAEKACLMDVVNRLPSGFDTIVGERGIRLSGGQRQRIGIARALYKEPRLLVLDEATSALDDFTERKVIASIVESRGGAAIVMVAHRLSTMSDCNSIVELSNGAISWRGTYQDLLKRMA